MPIKKRADGRYLINVYIGSVDGKAKYKSVYGKTPVEVRNKAALIRVEYNKGVDIVSGDNASFKYWSDLWLQKMERSTSPEWYAKLAFRAKVWQEAFELEPINKIKTIDCENVLADIAKHNLRNPKKKSSDKTIKEYANIITRILDFCVQNQVLTFNPAKYITKPKGTKKSTREPLTDEQIRYFVDTPHKLQTACMIIIFAGLRKGEVLALQWEDIDLKNKTITVNKAVNHLDNNKIKAPKTEAGNRIVPIPKNLLKYLTAIKNRKGLVINSENSVINKSQWESLWNNYIKVIKNKYHINIKTSAHCLRHTYCTLLYEAGIDILTAKKYMGHADIQTTMKIYTHLRDSHEQKAIDKLDNYISSNTILVKV